MDAVRSVPGPVRDAGTYHVATGTWTRPSLASGPHALGVGDTIYSNTTTNGNYLDLVGPTGAQAGGRLFDEGGIPGLGNSGPFQSPVLREVNLVSSFEYSYCDLDPAPQSAGWTIRFYESYNGQSIGNQATAVPSISSTVQVTGFPSAGCWSVLVDLTGSEFCLTADGGFVNPGFQNVPKRETFGISLEYSGSGTAAAGPMLAGHPDGTDPTWVPGALPRDAQLTYFGGGPSPCTTGQHFNSSTGYLNYDALAVQPLGANTVTPTSIGGYVPGATPCDLPTVPYAGVYLEINSSTQGPCSATVGIGQVVCAGAPNSDGGFGNLTIFGSPVAADDDIVLVAGGASSQLAGFFIVGRAAAAVPIATGNGFLCIDPAGVGGIGRFNAQGQIKFANVPGEATLSTQAGEWSTSMIPDSSTLYAALPGTTNVFQFWYRDPGGAGYNFTGASAVTWQ